MTTPAERARWAALAEARSSEQWRNVLGADPYLFLREAVPALLEDVEKRDERIAALEGALRGLLSAADEVAAYSKGNRAFAARVALNEAAMYASGLLARAALHSEAPRR